MRSLIRVAFWITAVLGAIGVLLYLFVFDTWVVPAGDPLFTASLAPTLAPGDRILVLRGRRPKVGQLARCASPEPGGQTSYVVGRVIGEGGDTVEIDGHFGAVDAACCEHVVFRLWGSNFIDRARPSDFW